ncbi:DNA polymerase lambda [Exophiala dermatitidis]
MVSAQEKIEKDRFFRDLYRLDTLDDDLAEPDSHAIGSPIRQTKTRESKPLPHPSMILAEADHEASNRASSPGYDFGSRHTSARPRPVQEEIEPQTLKPPKLVSTTAEKRKRADMPVARTKTKEPESKVARESNIKRVRPSLPVEFETETAHHHRRTSIPVKERLNVTDLSNIKQRKRQLGNRKKLPPVPVEQQMFSGLMFYFVPNNDICQARRFRIHKAVQYGATWANEWYAEVTHIIVCDGLDAKEASKEFWCGEIPMGPIVVNVNWLIECLSRKVVCEPHWNRFQVPGFADLQKERKPASPSHPLQPPFNKQAVDPPLQGSAGGTARRSHRSPSVYSDLHEDDTHSGLEENAAECARLEEKSDPEDELDNAIDAVRDLGQLPLELSFEETGFSPAENHDVDQALTTFQVNGKASKANAAFMCMDKHDGKNDDNPNAPTIGILLKMAEYHGATGDQWRTRAYRQAVAALRKQTQLVRTKEDALAVKGIGERIAEKIQEIVSTGRLQRLDNAQLDSRDKTLRLFMGIYHVGYPTASKWIAEGHRTLEDLLAKVDLNRNQRIGIEHYDDFQQRIPRAEVAQHAAIVQKELQKADRGLRMIVGGSYRRGNPDCGDIDLIIFKKDADLKQIQTLMMETVIPRLTARGFLKVALATTHHKDSGSKWHGASALPGSKLWRRIDFLFVPWEELGAALIYFTGNDYFNRSLRLLASRKGMLLNQHGLYDNILRGRGRERMTEGKLLEGHDEQHIFKILGVTYRPPEHRNP